MPTVQQPIASVGGPSDAYSPSNKPRLSALGTPDYTPPQATSGSFAWRFWGSRTPTLLKALSYSKLGVPLRNVAGGEQLVVLVVERVSGVLVLRQRLTAVLSAGATLAEFPGTFDFAVGQQWGVALGMNGGPSATAEANRFYENSILSPAPFTAQAFRTDDEQTGALGSTVAMGETTSQQYRSFYLTGVNTPQGVLGPANPVDVTFSGTTENRPSSPVNGQLYYDETLAKPLWWLNGTWRDAAGVGS